MKVLHVLSGDLWAGAEVQAFTLLRALQSIGGVEVTAVVLNDGALLERLRGAGISALLVPESSTNTIGLILKLKGIMAQWKPDIVHTHRYKENIIGSIANALSRNVPCLRTVHGAPEYNGNRIRRLANFAIRKLDQLCGRHLQALIISVSNELEIGLRSQFPHSRIAVIENGVALGQGSNERDAVTLLDRSPEGIHVGIVGRLVPVKRHDIFLEMAKALLDREPGRPWHFHVYGTGPLGDQIRVRARTLGIENSMTFHGHREDILCCLASLTVLVICSDHEGLPMTLLEALSVGTPVAAHAVGGIPDVLDGLRGAREVVRHNPGAYADAVRELLAVGVEDRNALTLRLSGKYSADANARSVYSSYCALLERPAP